MLKNLTAFCFTGNAVESGVKNFLGGEEQKDDGGKEDKEGFSFGKFLSSGDDGQKDVNEGSPSGGQTDEDNSGFGLANALNPCGGGQNDPDNGGLGSGDAKGGGQKNDDNTGAGEPGESFRLTQGHSKIQISEMQLLFSPVKLAWI